MRIEPSGAAALRAVLLKDLEAVGHLEKHIAELPGKALTREQLDSLGFALHNLYNALENSFTQISLSFENHVKEPFRWHQELLEKMFLEIPPVRPAVLPAPAKPLLVDLLGFRHFFRHGYEIALDETKTVALAKRWQKEGDAVKGALRRFSEQLAI
jgi:hypothetical protein